jgi:hypothetical protein
MVTNGCEWGNHRLGEGEEWNRVPQPEWEPSADQIITEGLGLA